MQENEIVYPEGFFFMSKEKEEEFKRLDPLTQKAAMGHLNRSIENTKRQMVNEILEENMKHKEMKNKEVIDKLVEYFREHADFDTMARSLANMMIDMKRFANLKKLDDRECRSLFDRTVANSEMLDDFIKNGSKVKFWLKDLSGK